MKRKEPDGDGAAAAAPENPAVFLKGVNELAIEQFDLPPLGPHDVRVAIKALGICQSDVHYLRHGRIADFVLQAPMVIGHECAGEVDAVGGAVTTLKVGDRVALEPGVACARCKPCKTGRYNLCPDMRFFATPPVHGSLARFVHHPADLCFPIPPEMSYEEAAMVEPLSVGVYACTKAQLRPGLKVLITGAGPIGLVTLLAARAFGAAEKDICVTDVDPGRLRIAAAVAPGIMTVDARGKTPSDILAAMGGEPADVTFDCAGFEATLEAALECTGNGGRVMLIGMGCTGRFIRAPLLPAAIREVDLLGSFRYRNTYEACIALIASGRIDVKALMTHRIDLSAPGALTLPAVTEGFEMAEKGGDVIKVMFKLA